MTLSLRAKFLMLSALVQALAVGLLIWNSLRLMDHAVSKNADRVAHEYAVTLNLSLGPYASHGRLAELHTYLDEMLADPADSFVRYIAVLDERGQPLLQAGAVPADMDALLLRGRARNNQGLKTVLQDSMLHARAPLLLRDNQVGTLYFGLSTVDLAQARDEVLSQGGLISAGVLSLGLLLYYAVTLGMGRRLGALTGQAQRLAQGDYGNLLPERGGDEIEIVSRSLNTMNLALRGRIADLEQAERRLRESEARFQLLFEMAPVPLAVSHRHGVLITANLALQRSFGAAHWPVTGRHWDQVVQWDGQDRGRMLAIIDGGGQMQGEICRAHLPDGSVSSMAVWSSRLTLDGETVAMWALLDLTAELNAERALKEMNASLEGRVRQRSAELERANRDLSDALDTLQRTQHDLLAAEKMASLGSLVAGVAHELNTPIGNSLLAATTLADRVGEFRRQIDTGAVRRSEMQTHLDEVSLASRLISGSLRKAADLIASFKQVAADQASDQRRVFDLLVVLQDTLATYGPRLQRAGCAATLAVPSGLTLDSFPGSLYQVVNNLINNALIHAFEGRSRGSIAIEASEADGGMLELLFRDDGVGMDEDVLRRVFDPFFTTKMGQGGTGLGMNIVYNIVTGVLGGRIDIHTAPGQGTTLRMLIPRIAPRRDKKAEADLAG